MGRHSPNHARRQRAPTRRSRVPAVSDVRGPAGDARFRAARCWSRAWEPSAAVWVRLLIPNLAACATRSSPRCAAAPDLLDRAPRERRLSTVAGVLFGQQRPRKSAPGRNFRAVGAYFSGRSARPNVNVVRARPTKPGRVRRVSTPGFAGSPARLPRRSRGRGRAGNGRRCPT